MKSFVPALGLGWLGLLLLVGVSPAEQEPGLLALPSGEELLLSVRDNLPSKPVTVEAELRVRTPSGATEQFILVTMQWDWKGEKPGAVFELRDRFGDFLSKLDVRRPPGSPPEFLMEQKGQQPTTDVLLSDTVEKTVFSWVDLSFDYLWWPRAERIGFEEKKGRLCHVVDVFPPPSLPGYTRARMWIDSEVRAVLEVELYGPEEVQLKRIKVRSFQKIEELWTLKDLDAINSKTRRKTTLRVQKMEIASD